MIVLGTTLVSLLVAAAGLAGFVRYVAHVERAEADPVGPVRLSLAERWAVADLERRLRRDGVSGRRPPGSPRARPRAG